jgi:hypothetical protein
MIFKVNSKKYLFLKVQESAAQTCQQRLLFSSPYSGGKISAFASQVGSVAISLASRK